MTTLKPELYGSTFKRYERTKLISTFTLIILLFIFSVLLPRLLEQKKEFYRLEYSEALFSDEQYRYNDFLDGTLNIDEIVMKKGVIESNTLSSKDPFNYLYIEKYLSDRLTEVGLDPFSFNEIYNFKNSGKNSIILDLTLADKDKLVSFISSISENGFLGKNISIIKEGQIYRAKIEVVFEIK